MSFSLLNKITVTTLAVGTILCSAVDVSADETAETDGVLRTFAVRLASAADAPDFSSAESFGLVVTAPERDPDLIRFSKFELDPRFESSLWAQQPAVHIAQGGTEMLPRTYWLISPDTPDVPPTGATTFTGPDSPLICSQELVYIKACTSGTCEDYSPGSIKYHVASQFNNGGVLLVVTAIFSR